MITLRAHPSELQTGQAMSEKTEKRSAVDGLSLTLIATPLKTAGAIAMIPSAHGSDGGRGAYRAPVAASTAGNYNEIIMSVTGTIRDSSSTAVDL